MAATQNATGVCVSQIIANKVKHAIRSESKQFSGEGLKFEFPDLSKRRVRKRDNQLEMKLTKDANVTQKKGHFVPLRLQESVEREIARLLKENHEERVNEVSDLYNLRSNGEKRRKRKNYKDTLALIKLNCQTWAI